MNKLTDEELRRAFNAWKLKHYPTENEEFLESFLSKDLKATSEFSKGWLRKARNGLFLSAKTVAEKLNVSRAAYAMYEESEISGSITLGTLAKAAEAMDCELVYAIRPKNRKTFSEIIWSKLLPMAKIHPWIKNCDQRRRGDALAAIAFKYMTDAQFRKKQNWTQRKN